MLVGVQNSMTIREIRMGFSKKLKLSHNPGIGHIYTQGLPVYYGDLGTSLHCSVHNKKELEPA